MDCDEHPISTAQTVVRNEVPPFASEMSVAVFDAYLIAYGKMLAGLPVLSLDNANTQTAILVGAVIGIEDSRKGQRRTRSQLLEDVARALTG